MNSDAELLSSYAPEERAHIVRLGIFLHEQGREFWSSQTSSTSSVALSLSDQFAAAQLKEELDRMKERLHAVREEEFKKGERRAEEYRREAEQRRRECEAERARCDKLIQGINAEVERASAARVDQLGKQLQALKAKNEWYYNMYEDKSKGKHYEEELYPRLLDYNDKHLNAVWTITHVGSVLSEKTDFHFRHKELGTTVLLDTKNNLPTNPVANTADFERDVLRKETNAVGGIMLANGSICNKKRFELNKVKGGKHLVFVSGFDRDNVAFVFALLDWLVELAQKKGEEAVQRGTLQKILVANYRKELAQLDALDRAKKAAQRAVDDIVADYLSYFNEDIEMASKSEEVGASSVRVKEKTSAEVVSIDELEQGRRVIGTRSKYYLTYDAPDPCIQYFKSNYARKQKMLQLSCPTENLVLDVDA
jgi:uncharacterized coiled-coil protein SlyX